MIATKLVTKVLQRYWRQTRGLQLAVRGVVRDAGGRVMLVREDAKSSWRLPGGKVTSGEAAEEALRRCLEEQCCIETTAAAHIFAVYADHSAATTHHVVVYLVHSWARSERMRSHGETCTVNLIESDNLPLDLEPQSMKCLGDVIARRQRSDLW